MSQSYDIHQSLVPALACLRVTNGGVRCDPLGVSIAPGQDQVSRDLMLVEDKTRDEVPVSA